MRYAGDRAVAEDMLQDGFITLFTRLDSYKGEGSFEGWARRIFVTTALMSLRKKDALKMSEEIDSARGMKAETMSQTQALNYKELMELVMGASSWIQDGVQHVRHRRILPQGNRRHARNQ